MNTKICQNCGLSIPKRGGRKFCSLACRSVGKMRENRDFVDLRRICGNCEIEFEVDYYRRNGFGKFCSMTCVGKSNAKRLDGTRNEEKYTDVECVFCRKVISRRKLDIERKQSKVFCNKSCATKSKRDKILSSPRCRKYVVKLKSISQIEVRSRWEAVFIKDFLELTNLNWQYEPRKFILENGQTYTPDFLVEDFFVEIKGKHKNNSHKVQMLRDMGYSVIYADKSVLENVYKLDLSHSYLSSICEKTNNMRNLQ